MKVLNQYQVDAFSDRIFTGNPAAVVPLEEWLPDDLLQAIAAENNLSETGYLVGSAGRYQLRWFTPTAEIDLCGHGTLASAHALWEEMGEVAEQLVFSTLSGDLTVQRSETGIEMDFPATGLQPCEPASDLIEAIGMAPDQCLAGKQYMFIYKYINKINKIQPNFNLLSRLVSKGVIITAQGEDCDFVSRFFATHVGINEDPVTGSAHCTLAPYWAKELGKNSLTARQLSQRGGELQCEVQGDRVKLIGKAVTFMRGEIQVPT